MDYTPGVPTPSTSVVMRVVMPAIDGPRVEWDAAVLVLLIVLVIRAFRK